MLIYYVVATKEGVETGRRMEKGDFYIYRKLKSSTTYYKKPFCQITAHPPLLVYFIYFFVNTDKCPLTMRHIYCTYIIVYIGIAVCSPESGLSDIPIIIHYNRVYCQRLR